MKISYCVTVYNEIEEIKMLIPMLMNNIRGIDEIIILFDDKVESSNVKSYLNTIEKPENLTIIFSKFDYDFSKWKNKFNDHASGDYIFQIDADEIINPNLPNIIPELIETNIDVDLFYFPRINIVNGITENHIKNWGWSTNENGFINFPDLQGRLYKKGLKWNGLVHERITGAKNFGVLPIDNIYCIKHIKNIEKQINQNNFYQSNYGKN
jgi:hypothetical protein